MTGLPAYVEFKGDFKRLGKEVMAKVKPMASEFGKMSVSQSKATKTSGLLDRSSRRLGGSLSNAAKYAAGAAAAYVSISQAKAAVSNTLELSKATSGLNRNLGLSVNVASRWGAVAKARDIDTKSMTMSFTILGKRFVDAAHKGGTAMEAFNRLGISQEDVERGSNDFQYAVMRTAKAFGEAEGGAKRQASAQALLGRGYATILPLFSEGSKSLKEQLHWADEFGVTLNTKTNDSLMELVSLQRESKVASLGLQVAFTKAVTPALVEVEKQYQSFVKLWARDDLSDSQKWEIAGKRIEGLAEDGLEAFTDVLPEIAGQAGQWAPKVASSFVEGFMESDEWGKLAIGAFLISRFGGLGAFAAVGSRAGAAFGIGMSEGAAAGMAGGGAAGVGAAAAGGGLAARVGTALRSIRWGRIGAVGAGLAIGDNIMTEVSRRMNERSDDLSSALDSMAHDQSIVGFARENVVGPYINSAIGDADVKDKKDSAKQLLMRYEEMGHSRIRMLTTGIQTLRQDAQSLDLTTKQRQEIGRMVELLQRGRSLKTNVDIGMDPAKLRQIQQGFSFLRRGVGANMADISKVSKRTSKLIAAEFGKGTKEGRKLTAENMRATAAAIGLQMNRSGNGTKAGFKRMAAIIRAANLVDPTRKQARDFGSEWAKGMSHSKDVTRQGVQAMIREANKMPGPMRQVALRTWLDQAKEARKSGDITVGEFRRMRSRVLSEFGGIQKSSRQKSKEMADGVVANVERMTTATGAELGNFRGIVNAALVGFGVAPLQFSVKGGGKEHKRQQGGIVPGSGDGDKVHTLGQVGSYVLNREATAAYGFRTGGLVRLALEPGERYFTPPEVKAIGAGNLEAMNSSVPRLRRQKGGGVGIGPEPQLLGMDPLRSLGQAAIRKVYEGGQDYLRKHAKAVTGGDIVEVGHSLQKLGYEVSENPAFGGVTAGAHVSDSAHYSGRAIDVNDDSAPFGHGSDEMSSLDWLAPQLQKLPHSQIIWRNRDIDTGAAIPAHMDHLHFAMMLGGLVQKLAAGGFAKGSYTVKGNAASAAQKLVEEKILGAADDVSANHLARVAITMAGIQESELGAASSNIFQLTGSNFGMNPSDVDATAKYWLKTGYYGKGGGLELSKSMNDPGAIAQAVEGSAHPTAYSPWKGEAKEWVDGWGGAGGGKDEAMAKQVKGSYAKHVFEVVKNGKKPDALSGKQVKGHYRVVTDQLSFGSPPSTLDECNKELRIRQRQLGEYRAAAAQTKDPETKRALEKNVGLLAKRITLLRTLRIRLLRAARTKRAVAKIQAEGNFAYFTAPNTGVFARREAAYETAQEWADQSVSLEPEEQLSGTTRDWIDGVLAPYVNGVESPAFGGALSSEAAWRNSILTAEQVARNRMEEWRVDIEKLQSQIAYIKALKDSDPKAYEKRKDLIPGMQQRIKAYQGDIKKTRTTTLPEWEETLGGVQGRGRSHEILAALPSVPTGEFGGNVFDTQLTIRGLGLKVPSALAGLGDERDAGREALLEQLLRESNQSRIAAGIEDRVFSQPMVPYAGKFHDGGVVPGSWREEKMALVRGGERFRTPEQELELAKMARGSGDAGHQVVVNHYGGDDTEVFIDGKRADAKINKHDRRTARVANRGFAKSGVFG